MAIKPSSDHNTVSPINRISIRHQSRHVYSPVARSPSTLKPRVNLSDSCPDQYSHINPCKCLRIRAGVHSDGARGSCITSPRRPVTFSPFSPFSPFSRSVVQCVQSFQSLQSFNPFSPSAVQSFICSVLSASSFSGSVPVTSKQGCLDCIQWQGAISLQ